MVGSYSSIVILIDAGLTWHLWKMDTPKWFHQTSPIEGCQASFFLGGGTGAARKPPNPLFERSTPPIFVCSPCLLSSSPPFHPSSPPPRRFGSSCFLLLVSAFSLLPSFFSQLIRLPQCPSSSIPPHSPHPFPLFSPLLCMCLLRLHYETPSATHLCFPPPPFSNQFLLPRHLFQPTLHGGHLHPFFFMLSRQRSPPPPVFLEEPPRLLRKNFPLASCHPFAFSKAPPSSKRQPPHFNAASPLVQRRTAPFQSPTFRIVWLSLWGPSPLVCLQEATPLLPFFVEPSPVFRTCPLPPYFKAAPGSKKNPAPFQPAPPFPTRSPLLLLRGGGGHGPASLNDPPSPFKERYSFNK